MAAISLHESSLRKQGPVAAGLCCYKRYLTPCPNASARRMGPRLRGDDALRDGRERHPRLSSPGLTGRSSTPRRLGSCSSALEYWIPAFAGMTRCVLDDGSCDGRAISLHESSLRKQGPIAAGRRGYKRYLTPCPNAATPRMGPRLRGDDALRDGRERHPQPSSPGLTGRSSTPRRLGSCSSALEYWIPAFAGMTACGRNDELSVGRGPCARTLTPC